MSLSFLFWATVLAAIVSFWWQSDKVKQLALKFVFQHCKKQQLQLLDQTMVLKGVKLMRDKGGSLKIRRRYVFEFASTGDARYQGIVSLLGNQLLELEMDAHIIPDNEGPHS